ncbi:hypothetical protein IC582_001747 [Cucumis melo]
MLFKRHEGLHHLILILIRLFTSPLVILRQTLWILVARYLHPMFIYLSHALIA